MGYKHTLCTYGPKRWMPMCCTSRWRPHIWPHPLSYLLQVVYSWSFSHFYPFLTISRPLCTQAALSFQTRGIWQLEGVVTLLGALSACIKDTSLLWTLQRGPMVSVIQRFDYNSKHMDMSPARRDCITYYTVPCIPYFRIIKRMRLYPCRKKTCA